MLVEALLVGVWAFFCGIDKYDVALNIHRPIITGPVVGLIMGNMELGLITGATLELAWLGLVPNAGAQPPDVTMGTIAAVGFAVLTKQTPAIAMGVGMPIAVIMQMIVIAFFAFSSFAGGRMERHAKSGNYRGISRIVMGTLCIRSLLYFVVAFLTIYYGENAAHWIDANAPKTLLEGLGIGAKMVPAIGFAMLLKVMWSKEVAGIFFIGFVMTTYLHMPIMAVAILGASAAIIFFYFSNNSSKGSDNTNNNGGQQQQLEDFEDGI